MKDKVIPEDKNHEVVREFRFKALRLNINNPVLDTDTLSHFESQLEIANMLQKAAKQIRKGSTQGIIRSCEGKQVGEFSIEESMLVGIPIDY